MFRHAVLWGAALLLPVAGLAQTAPGYGIEAQEGSWSLLRHEDADSVSYLLQSDSRDGGQRAEMICSATTKGEQPPQLTLVGKGTGKAELATLGPADTTGELEITDGKAPQSLWQAPATLDNPGNLNASLADLRGLHNLVSAAREAKLSLVVHADFKKRDLRAVYETPPDSLMSRLLDRCDGLQHWVEMKRPPDPPAAETPAAEDTLPPNQPSTPPPP
ncbi:MAG TPA: hypothetical protein VM661_05780 [Candidatus Sulfotelmatobacter sp.]|jgi:hypothetical protein|nr:hypothetical protein [Candidatus Sulfotelmatobacter sp.]